MIKSKIYKELFKVSRPRQWTKNLLIFAASLFTFELNLTYWLFSTKAFICFCCMSSAIYTLNDILDREADKKHESKKFRPIASGRLPLNIAILYSLILTLLSLSLSILISKFLFFIILGYFFIQVAYCFLLKKQPILDIFCIAFGFILRALAGLISTEVLPSHWFLLSIGFLALFLAIEKRKAELRISSNTGVIARKVLMRYSLPLLQRLESLVASSAFITYTLWSSGPSMNGAGTSWMLLSVPFVLVGIFRYQLLSDPDEFERRKINFPNRTTESPEEILLEDNGIRLCIIGWLLTVLFIGISNKYALI
ncbi:decaprenyl-phosphate phosphoribosyltransferase [uncultured Prochlorococcus sp.]|uniref:decaprenyl-phosphate phosphoribosyltransferase n=1 Tax=uncultured Prochlorococcus sp. TaxID=159733 RepID=UPI00258B9F54|nr:decaprenyl-phosphate phosphoribosyltransferase [uncultured Prochlorococcus sp.]